MQNDSILKEVLELHTHTRYQTNYFATIGLPNIIVLKNVFRPEVSFLGTYTAKFLYKNPRYFRKKIIIDVGCGCGVLSLLMAIHGATEVIAVDVKPKSVQNTRLNVKNYKLSNVEVRLSNLFSKVNDKKFDLIVFNAPFFYSRNLPKNEVLATIASDGRTLYRFFKEFPKYLSANGVVIMPQSDIHGKLNNPIHLSSKFGYKCEILSEEMHQIGLRRIVKIKP